MQIKNFFTNKKIFAFFWIFILNFIGLILVLGPKWIEGPIHIHLFNDHGFTTQDAIALIPISAGMLLFGKEIWEERTRLFRFISQFTNYSVIFILSIGISIGVFLGVPIGMILIKIF